jgi:hypothetical protein
MPGRRRFAWEKAGQTLLGIIGCLVLLSGCGTWGKLVNFTTSTFTGNTGRIKETVAIIPFSNQMPWVAHRLQTQFMTDLAQRLQKKCSRMILVLPGDKRYPPEMDHFIPAAGKTPDNIGLATLCQRTGINAVITGQLVNVTMENKKRGILWFKHPSPSARIEMAVTMYHAGTAAKLMDNTLFLEIPLSGTDLATLKREQVLDAAAAAEPLKDTAATLTKEICKRLKTLPWEGSIRTASAEKVTLPFGELSGLAVGDVLEVQNRGDLMVASNGCKYILPGLKVGRIRISAVTPYEADAVPIGKGTRVAAGDVARFPTDR